MYLLVFKTLIKNLQWILSLQTNILNAVYTNITIISSITNLNYIGCQITNM